MSLRDPVAVYSTRDDLEAILLRDALCRAGIPAFAVPRLDGGEGGVTPAQVWVDREDVERAWPIVRAREGYQVARRAAEGAAPAGGPTVEAVCAGCGRRGTFPAALRGTVQDCPHCGAYVDVEGPPCRARGSGRCGP
jgi:hypothetical protein